MLAGPCEPVRDRSRGPLVDQHLGQQIAGRPIVGGQARAVLEGDARRDEAALGHPTGDRSEAGAPREAAAPESTASTVSAEATAPAATENEQA